MLCAAGRACAGETILNMWPKQDRGILSTFRRLFRIKRSMQAQTNPSNAYSCARTMRPSWSILPISTPSNSQKRFTGPILFTSTPEEGPASNFRQWNAGRPVVLESAPCRQVAGLARAAAEDGRSQGAGVRRLVRICRAFLYLFG